MKSAEGQECPKDLMDEAQQGRAARMSFLVGTGIGVDVAIAAGANVNAGALFGETALMSAAQRGHEAYVSELIAAGAAVDVADDNGWTALMYASVNGHAACVSLLIGAGAEFGHSGVERGWIQSRNEMLRSHAQSGDCTKLKESIDQGAELDSVDQYGKTALMLAIKKGDVVCMNALLQAGATVNAVDDSGWTALTSAARIGHAAGVNALLQAGANVDATDQKSMTALMYAAQNGHAACVNALIQAGANLESSNSSGWTALMRAAQYGHEVIISFLIQANSDVHAIDKQGNTALIQGIKSRKAHKYRSRMAPLELLIAAGARLNAENKEGLTAISYAIRTVKIKGLFLLLWEGAETDPYVERAKKDIGATAAREIKSILEVLPEIQSLFNEIKKGSILSIFKEIGFEANETPNSDGDVKWSSIKWSSISTQYPFELLIELCRGQSPKLKFVFKTEGEDSYCLDFSKLPQVVQVTLLKGLDHQKYTFFLDPKRADGLSSAIKVDYVWNLKSFLNANRDILIKTSVLFSTLGKDLQLILIEELYKCYNLEPYLDQPGALCVRESDQSRRLKLAPLLFEKSLLSRTCLELLCASHPNRTQLSRESIEFTEAQRGRFTTDQCYPLLALPEGLIDRVIHLLSKSYNVLELVEKVRALYKLRLVCKALRDRIPVIAIAQINKRTILIHSSQLTGALPAASSSDDCPSEQHSRSAALENGPS